MTGMEFDAVQPTLLTAPGDVRESRDDIPCLIIGHRAPDQPGETRLRRDRKRRTVPAGIQVATVPQLLENLHACRPDGIGQTSIARDNVWIIQGHVEQAGKMDAPRLKDRRSEENTSELQSLMRISYAV